MIHDLTFSTVNANLDYIKFFLDEPKIGGDSTTRFVASIKMEEGTTQRDSRERKESNTKYCSI